MILSIIFVLLITFGIGLPLTFTISPKMNNVPRAGISFPLGIGIFTLVMYLTNLAGFRFTLINNLLLILVITIPLIFICRNEMKKFLPELCKNLGGFHPDLLEKVVLFILAFLILSGLMNNLYWPIHTWDALTLYDFRAKVFIATGYIKNVLIDSYYLEYPLLTSLAHTNVYLFGANNPKFLYTLFYISFGLSYFGILTEFVSRKMSMLFTLILLSAPLIFEHSLNSYTNLPFTIYFSLGSIFLFLWDKNKTRSFLVLSAIFVGLASWTRSIEPFWMGILLVIILTSIYRKRILDILIYSLFFFPIQQAWRIFQSTYGPRLSTGGEIVSYLQPFFHIFDIKQWFVVLPFFYNTIIKPWGPVFLASLISCAYLVIVKKWKSYFLIFLITFVLFTMLVFGTFVNSYLQESGCFLDCGDAATRLSMVIYPLLVFCSALAVGKYSE